MSVLLVLLLNPLNVRLPDRPPTHHSWGPSALDPVWFYKQHLHSSILNTSAEEHSSRLSLALPILLLRPDHRIKRLGVLPFNSLLPSSASRGLHHDIDPSEATKTTTASTNGKTIAPTFYSHLRVTEHELDTVQSGQVPLSIDFPFAFSPTRPRHYELRIQPSTFSSQSLVSSRYPTEEPGLPKTTQDAAATGAGRYQTTSESGRRRRHGRGQGSAKRLQPTRSNLHHTPAQLQLATTSLRRP